MIFKDFSTYLEVKDWDTLWLHKKDTGSHIEKFNSVGIKNM